MIRTRLDIRGVRTLPPNRFRTGYVATAEDGAVLAFASKKPGHWTLHYRPAPEAIRIAKNINSDFSAPSRQILLVEGTEKTDVVVTYPLNTTATSRAFLDPKYATLRTITLDGFRFSDIDSDEALIDALRGLPSGFVKDPYFGLGLNYDLRYLIESIEEIDGVTDLRLRRGRRAGGVPVIEGATYAIGAGAFDDARKAINRIHEKALSIASEEKWVVTHNTLLTAVDPKKFPEKHREYRKDAILEAIGKSLARTVVLSAEDRKAVVAAATTSARSVRRSEPEALLELNREIEVVTLEELVVRLKKMLSKKLKESAWQTFFAENPFVLRLAFGLPIMMIGDQISVGGRKFSGSGDKISDFAVKAAASGNLALVEIKTPETAVVESAPYRGDLHGPGRELAGAVNQVLDQRYQLQKTITVLKDSSGIWDVESYAIQGLVIAGRTPEGKSELKSFELFRNGLKSVLVITFDELLSKLEHLLEVLRASLASAEVDRPASGEAAGRLEPSISES